MPARRVFFAILCAAGTAAAAPAVTGWDCSNEQLLEISCKSTHCRSTRDFTPIRLSFRRQGRIDLCAYSRCWTGSGKLRTTDSYLVLSAKTLRSRPAAGTQVRWGARILVALDTTDRFAMVRWAGYLLPMHCTPAGGK